MLSSILDRFLPDRLEELLEPILGYRMPRCAARGRYSILGCGRFHGALTADLLAFAHNHRLDAALVLVEEDVERVLYFAKGLLVGASSNVLFERLGRLLYSAEVVDHDLGKTLVEVEEFQGVVALTEWIREEALAWALERRVWEVGAALYFMNHGHYVLVEGAPDLDDLPALAIEPMVVAVEGLRAYDEWRNSASNPTDTQRARPARPPPTAAGAIDSSRKAPKQERSRHASD